MPTYVVTGASSGIGLELVRQLAARGDRVYATVRSKTSSVSKTDEISSISGNVTIIEGVDVTEDNVGEVLASSALAGVAINVIVHNAGGYNGSSDNRQMAAVGEQSITSISADTMLAAFQLNTLGPMRVQQALQDQIVSPGGKVMVISTGMGSIGDNGSGKHYAYRCSKAAMNMMAKGWSVDLKDKEITVQCITPGMVVTDFLDKGMMASMGGMSVETSVNGILQVFEQANMETTGKFRSVYKDKPPADFPNGW